MKGKIKYIIVFGMLALGAFLVLGRGGREQTSVPEVTVPPSLDAGGGVPEGTINALGTIRPAQTLQLGFGAGAPVRTMTAHLGLEVRAGELLAELDTAALALELENAWSENMNSSSIDALPDPAICVEVPPKNSSSVSPSPPFSACVTLDMLVLKSKDCGGPPSTR